MAPSDRSVIEVASSRAVRVVVRLGGDGGHETLDRSRAYEFRGRLWTVEQPVGCVLCVEKPQPSTLVTTDMEGNESFHCVLGHGQLIEIPYSMTKNFVVVIGDVTREGEESVADSMLFPASLSETERTELIEQLLDEADEEEHEAGVE